MAVMNRYNSFIFGIVFASATWAVSLYLYSRLTSETSAKWSTHSPTVKAELSNFIEMEDTQLIKGEHPHQTLDNTLKKKKKYNMESNDIVIPYEDNRKSAYYQKAKYFKNNYKNSDDLIKKLQPKASKTFGLEELGMVKTREDQLVREEGYKTHAFNVLVSNHLSYHRDIPDTRHHLCKTVTYPEQLPMASIVVCFYNEHFNTLMRTVHSVVDRTPPNLLHEVILIDDFSDIDGLHEEIKTYIASNFMEKVILLRTQRREGLIRARMFGAKAASGGALVFLDSHVEVNQDWLQPLLTRIASSNTNVVMPIIDIINSDTFEYSASPLVRGGFNWGLHFKWENLPTGTLAAESDFIKPIKSPTMAGGLFAIDRMYFEELGEYDSGMNIWGGENLLHVSTCNVLLA